MADRPILFSAPMVRAILAGTKTQTRRVLKQATGPSLSVGMLDEKPGVAELSWLYGDGPGYDVHEAIRLVPCPYGVPGDRLWVREAWRTSPAFDPVKPVDLPTWAPLRFEADGAKVGEWSGHGLSGGKLRPGMFMPRWASRLSLEVTAVRAERLHDISDADAVAEGIAELVPQEHRGTGTLSASSRFAAAAAVVGAMPKLSRRAFLGTALAASIGLAGDRDPRPPTAIELYALLWDSINGAGAWARNPFVWVVSFRRLPAAPSA